MGSGKQNEKSGQQGEDNSFPDKMKEIRN